MDTESLAGAVVAAAVAFNVCAATPAAATGNNQVVGIEQTVGDPNGTEIAYTVSKIVPSADPVAYPIAGQLFEATVMARATQGTVVPSVTFFNARAASGVTYPALVNVAGLSAAPLQDGATTNGKIYFDVTGPAPTSIVYDNPSEGVLTWSQPIPGEPATSGSSGGSASSGGTGGAGGSRGVLGSTGPNEAVPSSSGGDIGGGQGGTEGGGGNLSSGGGSGAPSGDTGGNTGSGGGGSTGRIGGGGGSVGVSGG